MLSIYFFFSILSNFPKRQTLYVFLIKISVSSSILFYFIFEFYRILSPVFFLNVVKRILSFRHLKNNLKIKPLQKLKPLIHLAFI